MIGIRTLTAGACLAAGSAFWACGNTQSRCDACALAVYLELHPESPSDRYSIEVATGPAFLSSIPAESDSIFRINGGPGEYGLRIVRNGTDTLPALHIKVGETGEEWCRVDKTANLKVRIEQDSSGSRHPIILSSIAKPRC
jgi:hypothetical protein